MKTEQASQVTQEAARKARRRIRLVTVEVFPGLKPLSETLKGPEEVTKFIRDRIASRDREHFIVLHLNAKNRVVSIETVSIGTLVSTLVHPREVFKGALLANAAAIICAHNHPSGDLEPSDEDRRCMGQLRDAGKLLGVAVLDFLIVTETGHRSLIDEPRAVGRAA